MKNDGIHTNLYSNTSNEEAELAVIGAIITEEKRMKDVIGYLNNPEVFYYSHTKKIWKIILEMYNNNEPIDLVTLNDRFRDNDMGNISIADISKAQDIGVSFHAKEYALIIYRRYIQRQVAASARAIDKKSKDDFKNTNDILNQALNDIRELQNIQPTSEGNVSHIINETINNIKTSNDLIPFNIDVLDAPASGMTRKEVSVLGGRPGHGKTTLAINIVKSLVEDGRTVMLFNREMSNNQMFIKLLVLESGISYSKIRKRELSEEDYKLLKRVKDDVIKKYSGKLIPFDTVKTLSDTKKEIRRHPEVDVIIDDYIQLIKINNNSKRRFQIEEIMTDYKWIAKEMDCAVLLLSQLNRKIEERHLNPKPRMSDFAEGGTIEQVAENAIFVFFGFNFDSESYTPYEYEIIFDKTRFGKIGSYELGFNGDLCKIYSTSKEAKEADENIPF